MDSVWKRLFDFQRFETNPALQGVIDEVRARYASRELSREELDLVSAAGDPFVRTQPPLDREEKPK